VAKKPRTPTPPRPVQAPQRRDASKRQGGGRNWKLIGIVVAVAAIALGVGLGVGLGGGGGKSDATATAGTHVDFAKLPDLQQGPPPWDNGASFLQERIQPLNLNLLGAEGQVLHIHQHLDLWVNGKHVTVPALIGITPDETQITEVHTHDPTGVIHVESPVDRDYSLGQFFGEWGVWLSRNRIGDAKGKVLWWVNGKLQHGNPADLLLKAHQQIVLAVGKRPPRIPSAYPWNGL
jgi:hypothetical protein